MPAKRDWLASPALVPALAFLASTVYMLNANWHIYSIDRLWRSALCLLGMTGVIFLLSLFARRVWNSFPFHASSKGRIVAALVFGFVVSGILLSTLILPFRDLVDSKVLRGIVRAILPFIIALPFFFNKRKLSKVANIYFMFSIVFTLAAFTYSYHEISKQKPFVADAMNITLKTRPNIYLFWLESTHEPKVIDKYYGTTFVVDGMLRQFRERGFSLYEGTYANSGSTLLSMFDLFSMSIGGPELEQGHEDAKPVVRETIAGGNGNSLLKSLKQNGYYTVFLGAKEGELFHSGKLGEFLDSSDYVANYSWSYYITPLRHTGSKLLRFIPKEVDFPKNGFSLERHVAQYIDKAEKDAKGNPLFISFKGGAEHTGDGYTWRDRVAWVQSGEYRRNAQRGLSEALSIVDMIVSRDPDSIIILHGDHGPRRLRYIADEIPEAKRNDLEELEEFLEANGESLQSFADDHYNVFLAIRFPNGKSDGISAHRALSQANVFNHIFSVLNDNPDVWNQRQPSLTRFLGVPLVKEGIVQLD